MSVLSDAATRLRERAGRAEQAMRVLSAHLAEPPTAPLPAITQTRALADLLDAIDAEHHECERTDYEHCSCHGGNDAWPCTSDVYVAAMAVAEATP